MRVSYAIVFVSEMKRSIAFYRDILGLPLKFESPGWTEFATDGATLALHAGDPAGSEAANGAHGRAGQCRPGLSVPNLDEFHAKVTAAGAKCRQPPMETFGVRIAQYADPDGLVISVSEARGG